MRSVVVLIFGLLVITGCATVSVVSGEASVETSVTPEQSKLRNVSNAYTKRAKSENWVRPSDGLMGLAKVLMDGVSDNRDAPQTYADIINTQAGDVAVLYHRIAMDISAARSGLDVVTAEALTFIATTQVSKANLRRDVVSFESALVSAQKSRRSFAKAISVVASRSQQGLAMTEVELAAFDLAIDRARDMADNLANAHASAPAETAVS